MYMYVKGTSNNSITEFKQLGLFLLSGTAFLVSSSFFTFYLYYVIIFENNTL